MSDRPPVADRGSAGPTGTAPVPVAKRRRRRRRWPIVLAVVVVVLIGLGVIALVVGDGIFRDRAEQQIEQSVQSDLPSGVEGRVTAEIEGFSALQQWASGSFDHVVLRSSDLTIGGAPAAATIDLRGLPVAAGTTDSAEARISVGQRAFRNLPALKRVNASAPQLGQDRVTTSIAQSFLGLAVTVKVVLTPSLLDQVVHLEPTDATLTAGPASVPATAIVRQLLPDGVDVCAAQYLPQSVRITNLAVRTGVVQATLQARDVDLAGLGDERKGSCG